MQLTYPRSLNGQLRQQQRERSGAQIFPPLGVYDPEQQLSEDQIIELKQTLKDDRLLTLAVCAHLATQATTYFEDQDIEKARQNSGWLLKAGVALGLMMEPGAMDRDEFAERTALLSASYSADLAEAIEEPGSEWPFDMPPPATFAEALKEVRDQKAMNQEHHG